ncbi:hypothetical protein [Desulfovibrio inopinatus]|uniref:hypothetical protein n=1 Tax=Desulfovibrio inopinatus TaxID=102109 RepID=UPI0003FB020E|nr:hypothetical protein [Desulfovibrio inopinatus]
MWDAPQRGRLTGSTTRLARSLGLSVEEFTTFLHEARETGLADVTVHHDDVTNDNDDIILVNRRMLREHNVKYNAALRKKRQRERDKAGGAVRPCHSNVTPPSSSSSPSPKKEREKSRAATGSPAQSTSLPDSASNHAEAGNYSSEFLQFWKAYPNKANQDDAWFVWQELGRAGQRPSVHDMHAAISAQRGSSRWQQQGGRFIPDPANWLRKRRWRDALPPAVKESSAVVTSSHTTTTNLPKPRSYAQCQDAERRSQAVFALRYMKHQQLSESPESAHDERLAHDHLPPIPSTTHVQRGV